MDYLNFIDLHLHKKYENNRKVLIRSLKILTVVIVELLRL